MATKRVFIGLRTTKTKVRDGQIPDEKPHSRLRRGRTSGTRIASVRGLRLAAFSICSANQPLLRRSDNAVKPAGVPGGVSH